MTNLDVILDEIMNDTAADALPKALATLLVDGRPATVYDVTDPRDQDGPTRRGFLYVVLTGTGHDLSPAGIDAAGTPHLGFPIGGDQIGGSPISVAAAIESVTGTVTEIHLTA